MYFVHPQIKLNHGLKAKLALVKPVDVKKITEKLGEFLPGKQLLFTDMGRTAFKAIIEGMKLENSEMLLPAYICDIFYPILKSYNIKPVFLDIDLETFNVKPEEVRRKITANSRAILVCHTYGLPCDIEAIREAAGDKVIVIEDCAHAFFTQKNGVYAGNLGDVSFFSLYKQFPTLRGGMLACPKDWSVELSRTYFNRRDFLSFLNYFWPFAFFFKKFGSEYAKTHLREEKLALLGAIIGTSLKLFADFFNNVRGSLAHRKQLALLFQKELKSLGFSVQITDDNVFCYLSVLVPESLTNKRDKLVRELRKYGIFCTRIWSEKNTIILNEQVRKDYQIDLAQFPNTLAAARRIVNFPLQNHYTEKDVKKMVEALKKVMANLIENQGSGAARFL